MTYPIRFFPFIIDILSNKLELVSPLCERPWPNLYGSTSKHLLLERLLWSRHKSAWSSLTFGQVKIMWCYMIRDRCVGWSIVLAVLNSYPLSIRILDVPHWLLWKRLTPRVQLELGPWLSAYYQWLARYSSIAYPLYLIHAYSLCFLSSRAPTLNFEHKSPHICLSVCSV